MIFPTESKFIIIIYFEVLFQFGKFTIVFPINRVVFRKLVILVKIIGKSDFKRKLIM